MRTYVTGHRNPDIDSLASAYALAELRRRQGMEDVVPLCPGLMPERAAWLFDRFNCKPPVSMSDVHLRVGDIMDREIPIVSGRTSLYYAVKMLRKSGYSRLPVSGPDGELLGMLSPLCLLENLLDVGAEQGLAGREINTSLRLMAEIVKAKEPSGSDIDALRRLKVYVGAMGADSFDEHLPRTGDLAVIVGDRPDIHLRALQHHVRVLIVTGGRPVDQLISEEAGRLGVAILLTDYDSATVIRRLRFSSPVEESGLAKCRLVLEPGHRVRDISDDVLEQPEDVIPVVDASRKVIGAVLKRQIGAVPPSRMILVDHNETSQSIPGAEELPVIEVVDHHRIGFPATKLPIKFTADVVGSTCTLVAMMYRSAGESLPPGLAGLLLGGIVSDTLNLISPTTSRLDHRMVDWLEKLSGVSASDLMGELCRIASPLVTGVARDVIDADRKSYSEDGFSFSLSQVEESNLALLERRREELERQMDEIMKAEKLDFIGLMVTDAVRGNSRLLLLGDRRLREAMPFVSDDNGVFSLPGVVSRKKQLLPQVLALISTLRKPGASPDSEIPGT
ncbi:MAG: putative manganese-dependent inorganic diphosphatase [Victivallaceae bacterium]|nr:putative manganese-dependent inorganic diphosphatase [Victivallaceae bacterium]